MSQTLYFHIQDATYQRFQQVNHALAQRSSARQAKILGAVLADLAIEVMDQVFAALLRDPEVMRAKSQQDSQAQDSEKVIAQILSHIKTYMPYAVSMFGNDRLLPMVQYLETCMQRHAGRHYLSYQVDEAIFLPLRQDIERIAAGEQSRVQPAFQALLSLIDAGVQALIIHPKSMLKFNFLINKTLDGVIHMCTRLGYQRLEKVTAQLTAAEALPYLAHFLKFSDLNRLSLQQQDETQP